MVVKSVAINAYQSAMGVRQKSVEEKVAQSLAKAPKPAQAFSETLGNSLKGVNSMQSEKKKMIEEFASGKSQNVHELMITMQKAGLAMQMTGAVRNKIMASYQEVMKMPF